MSCERHNHGGSYWAERPCPECAAEQAALEGPTGELLREIRADVQEIKTLIALGPGIPSTPTAPSAPATFEQASLLQRVAILLFEQSPEGHPDLMWAEASSILRESYIKMARQVIGLCANECGAAPSAPADAQLLEALVEPLARVIHTASGSPGAPAHLWSDIDDRARQTCLSQARAVIEVLKIRKVLP